MTTGTPLQPWSALRGAVAGDAAICPVAGYGDEAAEYAALREGAGLWDAGAWGVLRFSGPSRLSFLHKYCTQDVKDLAPGAGAYGCCLTVKGGMVADLRALAREDDALVLVPPAARAALPQHLAKYALFDKVTIAPADDLTLLGLHGPRAAEVAGAVLGPTPEGGPWSHAARAWSGHAVQVALAPLGALPGLHLVVPRDAAPGLADALVAAGARPVGSAALEQVRVEEGVPLFGVDLDERTIPIEAGLEAQGISFTKGCYIGQEVIARIAHRGHVNRTLAAVRLAAPPAAAQAPLLRDGKEVGAVTTWARSPRAGALVGLALLHRKHADPGTTLEAGPGGPAATVIALPVSPA
ncbi:MAG: aminomethyl transferase family protein [Planctomycetes bacterium]|nr:aminomethyl transferase family protein [Planctomycetota bacterium]